MNGSIVILIIASVTVSVAAALAVIGTIAASVLAQTTAQDSTTSLATRIQITKYATNSYTISEGSSRVGSFDTIYTITGSVDDISGNGDLIASTIQGDFNASSIVGYVLAQAAGNDTQTAPTLPSPFATGEEINQRIADEIRKGGEAAERSDEIYAEINCHFGMDLPAFECRFVPLVDQVQ